MTTSLKIDKNKKQDWFYQFDELFKKYGSSYGVEWITLKSIAMNESNLGQARSVMVGLKNPKDEIGSRSSDKLSWGLMQMTLTTAGDFDKTVTYEKLNNPKYSIEISSRFIRSLMKQFSNERDYVMAYNQGAGNQKRFIELEKTGRLLDSQYPAAKDYWIKYSKHKMEVQDANRT